MQLKHQLRRRHDIALKNLIHHRSHYGRFLTLFTGVSDIDFHFRSMT